MSGKLVHYEDRISDLGSRYDSLAEKVETVTKIDLVNATGQIEEMSEQVENLAYVDVPDLQSQVDEIEKELSDVKMKQVIDEGLEFSRNSEQKKVIEEAEKEMDALKQLVQRTYRWLPRRL